MHDRKLWILGAVIAAAMIFVGLFFAYADGAFKKDPVVETSADNCYSRTLRVVTDQDYKPYSFFDEKDGYSGHDVELINMVANKLQMNLELSFLPWNDAINAINEGKADVLMTCDFSDSFPGTAHLLKSESTTEDDFTVFSSKTIKSVTDLYGKKIAVMKSGNVTYLIDEMGLDVNCIEFPDNRQAFLAVERGEVDCAIMRNTVGEVLRTELGLRRITPDFSIGVSFMCFDITPDNPQLLVSINNVLHDLKMNGVMERLADKWLTSFVKTPSVQETLYSNPWIIVILIVLLLSMVFLVMLNHMRRDRARLAEKSKEDRYQSVIATLADDYDLVCLVNVSNEKEEIYKFNKSRLYMVPGWSEIQNFDDRLDYFLNRVIHPDDRNLFFTCTRKDHVLSQLALNDKYSITYRNLFEGVVTYWRVQFSKVDLDEPQIVAGFREITSEVLESNAEKANLNKQLSMIKALSEEYILLCYLDLASGKTERVAIGGQAGNEAAELLSSSPKIEETFEFFVREYIHPDDRGKMRRILDHDYVRRLLKDCKEYKQTYRRLYGEEYKWSEVTLVKSEELDEEPINVAVGFAEIDERYKAQQAKEQIRQEYEAELIASRDKAEKANRAKTDFLFNMSHDLRTPMNAILGFADMAQKNLDDSRKVESCVEKIKSSGNQLLKLLNRVLELSRIETGQNVVDAVPCNIEAETKSLLDVFEPKVAANEQVFTSTITIRDPYVIMDSGNVSKIMLNILSNAVKYTPKGGRIHFQLEQLAPVADGRMEYRWTVRDTGIGMSPEFQKHMFERFSRERNSTQSGIEGTGLGMFMVKELVDLMGGKIEVYSKQNVGTSISIILPLVTSSENAVPGNLPPVTPAGDSTQGQPDAGETRVSLKGRRVLLVEDNELNREIATAVLQEAGMNVEGAEDGSIAIGKVRDNGPSFYDFILMDIQMPVMNGYTATKAIREMYPYHHIPIIAFSANAFEEDRQKSLEAGMDDHVAKPLEVDQLLRALRRCL